MNGEELQECARARVDELPGAVLEYPFGPEWEVFKVRDKVFMLMMDVTGDPRVTLKADPEDSKALREQFDAITPGYHMNKKHWNTVTLNDTIPRSELLEMIDDSYDLVVKGLTRAKREELARGPAALD